MAVGEVQKVEAGRVKSWDSSQLRSQSVFFRQEPCSAPELPVRSIARSCQSLLILFVFSLSSAAIAEDHPSPLPPAESAPAFEVVRDRTPIAFRETAAYAELLKRAREQSDAGLDGVARRDILYSDLATNPSRYRGLPIRVQGTARLIHPLRDLPESLAPKGNLYEAWIFTADGRGYPMVLVFEDLPDGLPTGDNIQALVVFRGYFLKLLAYQAGDSARFAPMLVGRIEYSPSASPGAVPANPTMGPWTILPLAMLGTYVLFRIAMIWQRGLIPPRRERQFMPPATDKISPEELDAWLSHERDDANDPPRDENSPER
jgi:hypothetical protein